MWPDELRLRAWTLEGGLGCHGQICQGSATWDFPLSPPTGAKERAQQPPKQQQQQQHSSFEEELSEVFEHQNPEAKPRGQCGPARMEGGLQGEQRPPGGAASSEQEGSYHSLPFTSGKPEAQEIKSLGNQTYQPLAPEAAVTLDKPHGPCHMAPVSRSCPPGTWCHLKEWVLNTKQSGSLTLKLARSSLSSIPQLLTLEEQQTANWGFYVQSGQTAQLPAVGLWSSSGPNRGTSGCIRHLHICCPSPWQLLVMPHRLLRSARSL